MRKRRMRSLVTACLAASVFTVQAFGYSTSAASAILIEQGSGRILYAERAQDRRLIASITKIMTTVAALEHGDMESQYTVSTEDMAEGSSMYLVPGETLSLEELLYGLMLCSGNDAALAVARCVSGDVDTFVGLMNDTAKRLGMVNSSFTNPNGLDGAEHYSTAADMAVLTAYAMENPAFRRIVSTASAQVAGRTMTNHNKLLKLCEGCVGVKTGYTKAAGRTLVSAVERESMMLICVTLSDGNDWEDHMNLYDLAFGEYDLCRPLALGEPAGIVTVTGGIVPAVVAVPAADLSYPVKEGERVTVRFVLPAAVSAPVLPGQKLGRAVALLDGREVAAADLIAAAPVDAKIPLHEETRLYLHR